MVNFPIGVSYFLSRSLWVSLRCIKITLQKFSESDKIFSSIASCVTWLMRWCYNVKSQKIHKQTNKQSFLIWRHAHSWWSRAYGLYLISRSSSSPHLLVPYTHATPISSKKQMKRSGSVPVKLSNSCNQYSPEVWQNSSPTMRQKRHVRPGKD